MTGFNSKRAMRKSLHKSIAEIAFASAIGVAFAAVLVYGWPL